MKVIQTFYKGFHFRSRLEARYAVMFDAAGLEWVYEPEGYELPSGRYLPDFYIPKWDAFVEIKGKPPGHLEFQKCYELSVAADKLVILFEGQPETDKAIHAFTTKAYAFNASAESTLFKTSYLRNINKNILFDSRHFEDSKEFITKKLGCLDVDLNRPCDRRRVMDADAAYRFKNVAYHEKFNYLYQYGMADIEDGYFEFMLFSGDPVYSARSARFEFGGR